VAGGGQHVDVVFAAAVVLASIDGVEISFEGAPHQVVSSVVIVAILGAAVEEQLPLALTAGKIGRQDLQQLWHAQGFVVEDVLLDRGQGIGEGADAHALDVGGVVACPAGVVILAAGDAVIGQQRKEGGWHVAGVQALDDLVAAHLDIQEVLHLAFKGGEQFVEGCKTGGFTCLRAQLPPAARVTPVVQGQLEHLGQVEVAGQNVSFFAEGAHLHAARRAAAAGIADGFAHAHQLFYDQVRVEYGGLPEAGADDLGGAAHKAIGVLLADLHRGGGLEQAHLPAAGR